VQRPADWVAAGSKTDKIGFSALARMKRASAAIAARKWRKTQSMRPSNKSRSRNKSGNNNQRRNVGNIVNRVFESAGPDGKVRGTPQQIIDKYQALARDAQVSGDRVAAENHLQHAEHYARLLGEALRQMQDSRQGERDDREDRDDAPQRDHGEAPVREHAEASDRQGEQRGDRGDRHQPRQERRRQDEPSGLTTFGSDDGEDRGPVETPEEFARHRESGAGERAAAGPAMNGEHRPEEPAAEAQPDGAPAKRPRTRRKAKTVIQAAEASAE
jgi:hypothetical protein